MINYDSENMPKKYPRTHSAVDSLKEFNEMSQRGWSKLANLMIFRREERDFKSIRYRLYSNELARKKKEDEIKSKNEARLMKLKNQDKVAVELYKDQ